jgi:WD40 repeat protein
MNEHEEPLETVDVLFNQGLILTSSADGHVKIWNTCKELIREIKFNEDIKEAVFLNDEADIVIAHGG